MMNKQNLNIKESIVFFCLKETNVGTTAVQSSLNKILTAKTFFTIYLQKQTLSPNHTTHLQNVFF